MSSYLTTITIGHFLVLAFVLFSIGVVGVLVRRNALIVMMSIELMLNAANMTIIAFARQHGDPAGHAFAFVVIAVAAAEVFRNFLLQVGKRS